jgi:thiosulfate dehydrogenase
VAKNRETDMKWPFSMRWGLSLWNAVFLDDAPFKPDSAKSASGTGAATWRKASAIAAPATRRAAWLSGKDHGPGGRQRQALPVRLYVRRLACGEPAQSVDAGRHRATAENGPQQLRHGGRQHDGSHHHSTQYFTDADLDALAQYLHGLPARDGAAVPPRKTAPVVAASSDALYNTRGGLGYLQFCATCHRRDGRGVDNIFPPLAQNDSVQSKDATTVIHIALTGWQSAVTQHSPCSFGMPAYDRLSDTELAEILTVRGKWNQGAPARPQIAKVRKELKLKAPDAGGFVTPASPP